MIENNVGKVQGVPLAMEHKDRLHIWGVTSLHKDVPISVMENKIYLTIAAAYHPDGAILSAEKGLRFQGLEPRDFILPHMIHGALADDLISGLGAISKKPPTSPAQRSIEDLSAHVLYVFDTVGTPTQKKTARSVVEKFKTHAK